MATKTVWLTASIVSLLALTACSANHSSIFRTKSFGNAEASITFVDAKQRAILLNPSMTVADAASNKTVTMQRFCAEPSPDVFSVVAQALSAGGTFGQRADPKTLELALDAAFSSSEQGATIPRTQTVNMLRELMYRTCERYLNGAIGSLELPIQAARDQRLMVSILAIESLTGTVTPKPVVIGAGASASGGASGAEAAVRLDDAYKDLQAKTAAQQSRQNEFNDVTTQSGHCEQIAEAVAKKEEDQLPQAMKDKRARCESTTSSLADAKKATASSASHYATLKDTAASGGIPVSTTATVMQLKAEGGVEVAQGQAVARVAEAVKQIVLANMDQDEFAFLCMKVLDPNASRTIDTALTSPGSGIKDTCVDYVNSQIEKSTAVNNMIALNIAPGGSAYAEKSNELFEKFWSKISTNGTTANPAAISAIRNQRSYWPACFPPSGDKSDYLACFNTLSGALKHSLSR